MTIRKCDRCKKTIKSRDTFTLRFSKLWQSIELCESCAKPVIQILKKDEILQHSWLKELPESATQV
ncbi:hypothetical protein COY17_04410 [Candidatus Saccharibacteria bacterium CG_4_10_14_0_2_um_filter_52_9]|nr:MAG: hypothetical protein COY17_04410 [Candidatus Saccharibacteria bacterium CG_4_10_14_0_2_um_filter_52_9]